MEVDVDTAVVEKLDQLVTDGQCLLNVIVDDVPMRTERIIMKMVEAVVVAFNSAERDAEKANASVEEALANGKLLLLPQIVKANEKLGMPGYVNEMIAHLRDGLIEVWHLLGKEEGREDQLAPRDCTHGGMQ